MSLKKRYFHFFGLFALAFILIFSQSCKKTNKNNNFILITLDTQRADFISCYQSDNALTPNIDFLAKNGVLYENCFTLIPITLPSHASILFSEPPHLLKNYNNGQIIRKRKKRPSITTIFKKNGFTTAAFISLGVLNAEFGLDEGFDLYKDDFPPNRWYLDSGEVNQNVFPWLEENKGNKFFLWIHYSDPHDPYYPPDQPPDLKIFLNDQLIDEYCLGKYETNEIRLKLKNGKNQLRFEVKNGFVENPDYFHARLDKLDFSMLEEEKDIDIRLSHGWFIRRKQNVFFFKNNSIIDIYNKSNPCEIAITFRGKLLLPQEGIKELYRKEVEYMDKEIGKLLNKLKHLGLFKKSHILVVGDHGEGLGEYLNNYGDPHIGHIHLLYNIYMKVPLIIYNPNLRLKNIRLKEPVTLLDIAPTIMQIMGFKKLQHFQGRDLFTPKKDKNFIVFQETYEPEAAKNKFAGLLFPWHLIFTPSEKKFELYNLYTDPEEKKDIFGINPLTKESRYLFQHVESLSKEILSKKKDIALDKKSLEMLKSLGYIK
ncbi:MAG: sulfatase [Candidatus Aminicenantes bacterium]|nr:sulfatase [Candidatus Aminicenantes bacterium]